MQLCKGERYFLKKKKKSARFVKKVLTSSPLLLKILVESMHRWAPQYIESVAQFGKWLGTAEVADLGQMANKFPPQFKSHDRFGNRVNLGIFHPAAREKYWGFLLARNHNFSSLASSIDWKTDVI